MLLRDKNAVVYGGGGAIGSAVARGFAPEGARVSLAGRTGAHRHGAIANLTCGSPVDY
jgi:3-oxoacyl-[acyl-carrier protein] reductase